MGKGKWTAVASGLLTLAVLMGAWTRRDDLRALVSRDYAARREVLRLIESRRTAEHREKYRVVVPEAPPKVPESFEIRLEGGHLDTQLVLIELRSRAGRATGEMATKKGIFRGEVPVRVLDAFVRKAHYLRRASHELKQDSSTIRSGRLGWASHSPDYTLLFDTDAQGQEVFSCVSNGQAIQESLDVDFEISHFVHTWLCLEVRRLAKKWLRPVDDAEQRSKVIIEHFDRLLNGPEGGSPILTQVYAHLAVRWEVEAVLPALRQLGLNRHAKRLEIVTAEDPRVLLHKAVLGEDWKVATWALDYLAESATAEVRKEVLLRCLGPLQIQQVRRHVINELGQFLGDQEVKDALKGVFHTPGVALDIQIAAAGAILRIGDDQEAIDFLLRHARNARMKDGQLLDESRRAVVHLIDTASNREAHREAVAATLRDLLATIDFQAPALQSGMTLLVEGIARMKRPEDEDLLARYFEHSEHAMVLEAIFGMALLRPERAVEAARKRLRLYIQSFGKEFSYRWNVHEYSWLFCALEARQAILEIEAARAVLLAEETSWRTGEEPGQIELLLRLLRAEGLSERVAAAVRFVEQYQPSRDDLFQAMVSRFLNEGADPKDLAPLLVERPRKKYSTVDW